MRHKCRRSALALAGSTYGEHCLPLATHYAADRWTIQLMMTLMCAGVVAGVQSVGIEGEERDQLVVVGDGVDATSPLLQNIDKVTHPCNKYVDVLQSCFVGTQNNVLQMKL